MSTDTARTDTTPDALPFIGGVVLAVPCRVPQNSVTQYKMQRCTVQYVLQKAQLMRLRASSLAAWCCMGLLGSGDCLAVQPARTLASAHRPPLLCHRSPPTTRLPPMRLCSATGPPPADREPLEPPVRGAPGLEEASGAASEATRLYRLKCICIALLVVQASLTPIFPSCHTPRFPHASAPMFPSSLFRTR